MKKLFILLFILTASKGLAQTYTLTYSYSSLGTTRCTDGWHGWKIHIFENTGVEQLGDNAYNAQYPPSFSYRQYTIQSNPIKFDFELIAYDCTSSPSCDALTKKQTFTLNQLMEARSVVYWDCKTYQRCAIESFYPNVAIKNLDNASPNEICAGSQVSLAAFPTELLPGNAPDFPAEVYRWKYSLDNKATWIDVPATIRGNATNYIPKPTFSIQELLGDDHVNYLNKTIYFTLAYGNVTAIPIKYSPCAPTITNVTYVGPNCGGDLIQKVDVTFDRALHPGESLDRIKMKNTSNGSERNERIDISAFNIGNPNTYSFTNIDALENGQTYKIVYQAKMADPLDPTKTILKGFMESASTLNFTYIDPAKMKFEITDYIKPSCNGGNDGIIEIKVLSGADPYHFYKDGVEITPAPLLQNGKYYITGLEAKEYKIMVTDAKGCIEKI